MNLSYSMLATFAYHDIFNYPLTPEEIHQYLIGKKASLKSIKKEIVNLLSSNSSVTLAHHPVILAQARIKNLDNTLYALGGRQNIFTTRSARTGHSKAKLKKALFYSKILKSIPTIKLVAISGALAMNNSQKGDDIDLVIITAKNTLWTTRFFANTILFPFKRQPAQLQTTRFARRPNYKLPASRSEPTNNKACLNLFLDESDLKITPQNLYMAHEICQMKPLWDRDKTYSRFIKANGWVKKYLPNWQPSFSVIPAKLVLDPDRGAGIQQKKVSVVSGQLSIVERTLCSFQLWYMRPKITTEKIGETQLFFHPANTQDLVLKEYQKRLKSLRLFMSLTTKI